MARQIKKPSAKAKREVGKRGDGIQTASPRSRAAKRGWRTRRAREAFAKRSAAAKRGWKTRRENEARVAIARKGPIRGDRPLPEVITRRAYKPGRTSHTRREQRVEVVSRGPLRADLGNVIRVTVGTRTYTRRQDIEALSTLVRGAVEEGTAY